MLKLKGFKNFFLIRDLSKSSCIVIIYALPSLFENKIQKIKTYVFMIIKKKDNKKGIF